MTDSKRKTERIVVLLTPKEKAVIQREAKRAKKTASGVLRDAIITPAKARA